LGTSICSVLSVSDYRERHVSVVGMRPGVVLEYHILTAVKPLAPGEFWFEYSFPESYALTDSTLQIDVPKSREIKLKSSDHKFEIRDDGDRRLYTWSVKNFVPDRKKQQEVEEDDTPDVQLSSFTSWQQIASWYAKLQSERAVPDESVKKKADELTRGAGWSGRGARLPSARRVSAKLQRACAGRRQRSARLW
jgi:hypothetical protein